LSEYLFSIMRFLLCFVLLCIFSIILAGQVRYTDSDPRGALLLSEAILDTGTIRLDEYAPGLIRNYGYVFHEKSGHIYYYFPIGTSLAALPFVGLVKLFGVDIATHDYQLQIILAALIAMANVALMFAIARVFLPPLTALGVASVFWLGSSLASTGATALWSHDFAVLFAFLAIYILVKEGETEDVSSRRWLLLSACLFFAYLCRPTMVLFAPFALLYFFALRPARALASCFVLAGLLGGFVAFSLNEFGQYLPDYYLPARLDGEYRGSFTFLDSLHGNLLSPARGLLIFSPFLLGVGLVKRKQDAAVSSPYAWLLVGLIWPLTHVLVISRFPHWWAGHSFGPRLMTDALPGIYLLTVRLWPNRLDWRGASAKLRNAVFVGAILFSVAVNTGQGLFNPYTAKWNGEPNVDTHPRYLFDWRYPQFLYNPLMHEARIRDLLASGRN